MPLHYDVVDPEIDTAAPNGLSPSPRWGRFL
jgi:hypothetical protein